MSISSISSNSDYYQNYLTNGSNSLKQQGQQDFKSLADALQSGNLSGAQSAFASLLQMLPSSSSSVNQSTATSSTVNSSNATSSITNDLSALGQALQSSDLTGAQDDFSKLMQDMQSMQAIGGGHHHHHHHKVSVNSQDATSASTTGSSTDTNLIVTDLDALGQALQSGDLKSAGNAYSQLTQDMQSINSTTNSNAGFQQLLNMFTQAVSVGSSINLSA